MTQYIYTLDRQGNDRTFDATAVTVKTLRSPRAQYRALCESVDRAAAEGNANGIYEVRLLRWDGTVIAAHTAE